MLVAILLIPDVDLPLYLWMIFEVLLMVMVKLTVLMVLMV